MNMKNEFYHFTALGKDLFISVNSDIESILPDVSGTSYQSLIKIRGTFSIGVDQSPLDVAKIIKAELLK